MAFELHNLDSETRRYMVTELEYDLANDSLYVGKYLSQDGLVRYPDLLRGALESGTDASLSADLTAPGLWLETYEKRKPSGGYTTAKVPYTAPVTLAEGEFNRFIFVAFAKGCSHMGVVILRSIALEHRLIRAQSLRL
jgi:hypothetical protein